MKLKIIILFSIVALAIGGDAAPPSGPAPGEWAQPPAEGVKEICFDWDAASPTHMMQALCSGVVD